jgi:hypothetical protein
VRLQQQRTIGAGLAILGVLLVLFGVVQHFAQLIHVAHLAVYLVILGLIGIGAGVFLAVRRSGT